MTNGDRIRQMSNEELAKMILFEKNECLYCAYKHKRPICQDVGAWCGEGIKAYLESEEE
jgi:thioredoxin-related protein